jgi:NAD(P)-dependent dehydrogenase (short-subunit alcohol dehydrogenase family)
MDHFSLKNKKAFITGGCSGIGLAVAKRYISAGAEVVLADLHDGGAVAEKIGAHFLELNVTDENQFERILAKANTLVGKLDVLLNNAGIGDLPGTIEEGDFATWSRLINVNLFGVLFGLKHGPKHMADGGSIINTASQAALTKLPGGEPYAATKAAVISLGQTAALELGPRHIRVNTVCPTYTKTPMTEENWEEEGSLIKTFSPMNRVADISDMVGVFHFLAADESSFISGQSFTVDGGWTAGISYGAINAILNNKENNE